ncbi:MAG: hypothetical protein HY361_02345 [Candidatus Aenigmarchaeota archaeon]|nr:hypothetical protein [Candidatus Aenigmarchaeota archaeon]
MNEDIVFWILILAGAGIILSAVFAFLDIDMTSGITAAVLLFTGAQILLWKKIASH